MAEALNHLLDDDGRQTLASARATFDTLNRLIGDNQGSLDRGLQSIGDLGPAITELRAALRAVQRVAERLDDNATEFLFGSDQIQEYRP